MSKQLPSPKELSGHSHGSTCYQKPPQYAEINYHRPPPQTPVEVNKIGPTIQQGVIQCPSTETHTSCRRTKEDQQFL